MATTNGSQNDTNPMSLIRQSVHRLQTIATSPIPSQLSEKVSLCIVDYLSSIAAGLQAPWAQQIQQFNALTSSDSVKESHSWIAGQCRSTKNAAFTNAILAHSAIRDDMHLKSNSHIGSMVISACLALAQKDEWRPDQLIKGIIGGYEMAALLGTSVQQSEGYNRHFRPSGIVGAFGVAAAIITATNADEEKAVSALAFAANMASGFNEWAWAGGLEIYIEMGTAAQQGITASELANAGLTCSETLLEGRAGLFAALNVPESGPVIFQRCLESLVGENGITAVRFKPAPGCNYAQTPLAASLKLSQRRKLAFNHIAGIRISCTSSAKKYPGCDNPGPTFTSVQQTKMSIQFGVCAVLLNAKIAESVFQKFDDEDVVAVASKYCTLETAEGYANAFQEGRQPATVEVTLKTGEILKEELTDVPWLEREAVLDRFHSDMESVLEEREQREKLLDTVLQLETLRDLEGLWALFGEAKAGQL